jgi:predicted metal-dependent enzyme (double-stranded beta helix superfamily)
VAELVDKHTEEPRHIAEAAPLPRRLIVGDDFLPPDFARPGADFYQQYLL